MCSGIHLLEVLVFTQTARYGVAKRLFTWLKDTGRADTLDMLVPDEEEQANHIAEKGNTLSAEEGA